MLYATTRSNSHVETTHRAIHMDRCGDGGFFVPFQIPQLDLEQIKAMAKRSFGENVAEILNLFFSCNLTGWDVDFLIGRNPVQLGNIPHKLFIAEAWHCADNRFAYIVKALSQRLCGDQQVSEPTNWVRVAVHIAVIFATYGMLLANRQVDIYMPLDIAVTSGEFVAPMAAWYARQMGLPLGNIICGSNANGAVWDLLHRGEMSTGVICIKTNTPLADVAVPDNLERLVHGALGKDAVRSYLDKCRTGQVYSLTEEDLEKLREGMFASVVSDSRVKSIIHSMFRTNRHILGPYDALAYGSLLDYRATTGESRYALLLSTRSPVCDCELVAESMNVSVDEVLRIVSIGE